ncbi:hypothetical protein DFH09DRAFT_1351035 [Mycena vulgaris]|nr:hypothetical protein DFH09DRAFT_1351035 [Mycena vulgaris]
MERRSSASVRPKAFKFRSPDCEGLLKGEGFSVKVQFNKLRMILVLGIYLYGPVVGDIVLQLLCQCLHQELFLLNHPR